MAIKSQGILLTAESARAAAKVITGITAANPPVVSAATHGYVSGDIVYIDGVVGMTEVNGRAFVVANETAGTFELKGVDGTGYTAYGSGGSAYKTTQTAVGQITAVSGFDGESDEIDTSHLRSLAKEFLLGLQDFGNLQFPLFIDNADTGQALLRKIKEGAAAKVFTITLSDAKVSAFVALVKKFPFNAERNGVVTGDCTLRITNAPAWFA